MKDLPRIFVQIPSYRDRDCQFTVKDLFEKAEAPDRVYVGICWQFVEEQDGDCFVEPYPRPGQVRVYNVNAFKSKGVCWARSITQKLWRGEELTLQIDAHMRFEQGWDEILISMWRSCGGGRSVLSCYPPGFTPPDVLERVWIFGLSAGSFDREGLLHPSSRPAWKIGRDEPETPARGAFVAAGMIFGPSSIIKDVPYDPHLYFFGEECTLAARLWTSGYDIFYPNRLVIYHDWKRSARPYTHFGDTKQGDEVDLNSKARVLHLLQSKISEDGEVLVEIDRYGLGSERSMSEYEDYCGVEFASRVIRENARSGVFPQASFNQRRAEQRKKTFTAIWEGRFWGKGESVSGTGASLDETEVIRKVLPALFSDFGIRELTDAGRDDVNWQPGILGGLTSYRGVDVVEGLIEGNRKKFSGSQKCSWSALDIVETTLPKTDAILCRDCLTHLPLVDALTALSRMRASGAKYLIATTHEGRDNKNIGIGDWYGMNLQAPPFSFRTPLHLLKEELPGSAKALGVWKLADLSV